jgi:hypothetical protein
MNIFALTDDVIQCAEWHVDRHIVKMPLETAQMLCTCLNKIDVSTPYLPVHQKHPCTLWAGINRSNYKWLCELGFALSMEYTYRYNKVHKSEEVIKYCYDFIDKFPEGELTPFAQAMPDEFKHPDSIQAYRKYYIHGKSHLHIWTGRPVPEWIIAKKAA